MISKGKLRFTSSTNTRAWDPLLPALTTSNVGSHISNHTRLTLFCFLSGPCQGCASTIIEIVYRCSTKGTSAGAGLSHASLH